MLSPTKKLWFEWFHATNKQFTIATTVSGIIPRILENLFRISSHRLCGQHISALLPPPFFGCALQPRCSALSNAAQSPWTVCKLVQNSCNAYRINSWRFKYTTMFQHVPTEIVIVSKQTYWCFLCPDGSFPTHFVAGGIAPGSLPVTSCEILFFCNGLTRCV